MRLTMKRVAELAENGAGCTGEYEVQSLALTAQGLAQENEMLRERLAKIERAADRHLTYGGSTMAQDLRDCLSESK